MNSLNTTTLAITIKPNAKKTEWLSLEKNALKLALHAPPVDGKANDELIRFLSGYFKIPKKQIEIIRGEKNRLKVVKIPAESINRLS